MAGHLNCELVRFNLVPIGVVLKPEELQGHDSYFDEEGTPLDFCADRRTIISQGIKVILNKLPYLKSPATGAVFFTTPAVKIINDYVSKAKATGKFQVTINQLGRFDRGRLPIDRGTNLKYSAAEHFFIPGLIRSLPSDGYLTPVYFDKNVLVKFQHGIGYDIRVFSRSFGTLSIHGGATIPFGVNRSEKVVIWLGDLIKLDERELFYFYSENISPQYDLHSDFYNSQILNKWI